MTTLPGVDRQAEWIRLVLMVLGATLAVVGWARFAGIWSASGWLLAW